MSMNIIYKLVDPRSNEIRYIGKSEQGVARFHEHLRPSSLAKSTHKDNWIKELLSLNLLPLFEIVETFNTPEELFEAEAKWYKYYMELGAPLTNLTECGKGTRGYKHKDSTKILIGEKTSIRVKGQPLPEGMRLPKDIITLNGIYYRHCIRCDKDVPLEQFALKIKQKTYQGYCKSCHLEYERKYREINPLPTLSQEEYNKTRLAGAKAGGETSKTPERRLQASKQKSKAIQGIHTITKEIIKFDSALKAKEAGFQNSNIGQAIKYNKPYKGYIWSFL